MATIRGVIDGLKILARHGGDAQSVLGEHDIIYAGENVQRDTLTIDEAARMEAAGWHWDSETGSWARFT